MRKVEPYVLTVVSGWEFVALVSGRLPTITSLVVRLPRFARVGLVAGTAVWLAHHLDV